MNPRVKICCIGSVSEAKLAINYGASALGLVGHMPSGPGVIGDEKIAQISRSVPPPVATFLLTSETSDESIYQHHKRTYTNTIQIVDKLTVGTYQKLRTLIPSVKLVQVVHIIDESSVDYALETMGHVDCLLLDSGNPNLDVKILGGTGRIHNWKLSRKIVENSTVPVFLAGGLNYINVQEAIETVEPFGLDLCSGIRSNGKLDERKLSQFMRAVGN